MNSGIVIVDKQQGDTSQNVVSKLKRKLGIQKAGHIGTLDPLATGVLPILIGDATKLSKYLMEHDKTYIATIQLGQKTDTGDEEGKLIEEAEVNCLDEEMVSKCLLEMQGKQTQIPPLYSAIKVQGKKLYEYARAGEKIEIPPRNIEIYAIQLLQIKKTEKQVAFEVSCSKGTYIRVLCEDIAKRLGTVGYMKYLQRTAVEEFSIQQAVKLENVSEENIISAEAICQKYSRIELDDRKLELFLNGVKLTTKGKDGVYRVYHQEKFIGIGVVQNTLLKRDVIIRNFS